MTIIGCSGPNSAAISNAVVSTVGADDCVIVGNAWDDEAVDSKGANCEVAHNT